MEVEVETPSGLLRQMKVRIPAERVRLAVDQRLKQLAARAKIPGFRPGKAPFKVIEQQYGDSARLDAVSDLVQRSYPEALGKAGVNPAGTPKIDITAEKPGEALEYVAEFEVYPEIQVSGLEALKIDKPVVEITQADIDRLVDNLRRARRSQKAVDRAAINGDGVLVDFEGRLDGEPFQGGRGEKVEIELGTGQFLPDMERGFIGHSPGETFEIDVNFPEDYRAENLRGKNAQFSVTLIEVRELRLPEISDPEFLAAHNVDSEAALRDKGRAALQNERDKAVRNRLKTQAMDQLLAANPIDVPQALIDQEVPRLREEAASRMNLQNVPVEKRAELLPAALFEPNARRRVALGLLIGEVIQARQIKLDAQRVEKALDEIAGDFETPQQVKQHYRSKPELMQGLSAMVLEDLVVESLLNGVTPTEVKLTLEQLLNPQAKP